MSEPKIYVGKGKAGKYGTKISVCLTDLPKERINEFNGKKYINLENNRDEDAGQVRKDSHGHR